MSLARIRILLFALVLGAIALWITNQQPATSDILSQQAKKPLSYSWQAIQTTVWNLNPAEPEKQSIIQAKSILYKDFEKKSEYLQPRVELMDKKTISTLQSESGDSQEDNVLNFKNNVVITQRANTTADSTSQADKTDNKTDSKPHNTFTLTTDFISYNLQTNQLSTDAKVTIKQYNGQTTGTGLKANLKTTDLELLSDVKSTYYPQKMQPNDIQAKEP